MQTVPAWPHDTDHLADYADLDPAILASLRTASDEDALGAALETQLTVRAAQSRQLAPVLPFRPRATEEQRAA